MARKKCFDFCYFERDYEVYSDEEGIKKSINGRFVGEFSIFSRIYARNQALKSKIQDLKCSNNLVKDSRLIEQKFQKEVVS